MFALPDYLWSPQRRGIEQTIALLEQGKDVCLYSPTGGGKTEMAVQLLRYAAEQDWKGCFYVNRKLLIPQTAERFSAAGLPYGIRAADYDDCYDFSAPFQICSADSERSRVFQRKTWNLHASQLVIVDEAHLQKKDTMKQIVAEHKLLAGAMVVLLTATPVGLSHMADELVISGTMAEYRECKALVPAVVRSIEQPDLSKVKRNQTGEYILDGEKKRIYTQTIIANVWDRWKKYNPDARPTMLYAPGVAESVWFTDQFQRRGVNWCHIDATDTVLDGIRAKLTRPLWTEILERYTAGDIKGLSSRFKLREGIDVPRTYHCILATPIGSLISAVQTVGRVLRYSPETPDHVLITDHGGVYHQHGSPNHDKPWRRWWTLPEHVVSQSHVERIRLKEAPEPIRCPQCEGERVGGITCPHCGFTHEKSKRHVIMEDGRMEEKEGRLIRPKFVQRRPDTQELWTRMFWGFRKKKVERTFAQLAGFFAHTHRYHPPRDLSFMPKRADDWYCVVYRVPMGELRE